MSLLNQIGCVARNTSSVVEPESWTNPAPYEFIKPYRICSKKIHRCSGYRDGKYVSYDYVHVGFYFRFTSFTEAIIEITKI